MATRRWIRFVLPVMVEVDGDEEEITRVVMLPEETREDRDDLGHVLVYDQRFVRRRGDEQPQTHAWCVAEPRWEHDHLRVGPPRTWPGSSEWEEGFDLIEANDASAQIHPYDEPRR